MEKNLSLRSAYAMVGGELTHGHIDCITFDTEKDDFTYTFNVGDEDDKKSYAMPSSTKFYEAEEDFRIGKTIEPERQTLRDCCNIVEESDGRVNYYNVRYKMVNGEPVKVKLPIKEYSIDDHKEKTVYYGDDTEENTWPSREKCLANNEYIVVDENGNRRVRVGLKKRTRLTPKQRAMVEEFKAMADNLKKAGVGIVMDLEGTAIGFINTTSFRNYGFDYELDQSVYEHRSEDNVCMEEWDNRLCSAVMGYDNYFCYNDKKDEE